jgi:hypothetical protein
MSQIFRKTRILFYFLVNAVRDWRREVLPRDLDEQYCCDGRECGCGGDTVEQVFGGRP